MPDHQTFKKSIFAYELARIMKSHNSRLYEFTRKPLNFDRKKVEALVESLSGIDRLPALSHDEIEALNIAMRLTPEERSRIHASLIALSVQRFMLSYLTEILRLERNKLTEEDCERAWNIALEVRDVALGWLIRRREDGDSVFRGRGRAGNMDTMPVMPSIPAGIPSPAATPRFIAALTAYDEAITLSSLGQMKDEGGEGQLFLEQAQALLQRALYLLEQMPPSTRPLEDWAYWHDEARKSLAIVQHAIL